MILIAGTVTVDPERRDEAIVAACPHMVDTRAQEGCIDYVWSADPLVPGRIYVFERWENQAALEAHFKGPYYLAMRNTIASFGLTGADVLKYRPEISEQVYDSTGTPRADFFTDGS
jgi:quinol monooxygenase YgiN